MQIDNILIGTMMLLVPMATVGQSIDELIQMARDHNPGLKAMQLEYQAALNQADQVKDYPDPTINAGIGVLPIETRLGAQVFKFGVSQHLPWKGLLDARGDVLRAQARILAHSDAVKEKDIAYSIRTSYAQLIFLERQRNLINQKLEILGFLDELAQSQVRSGSGKLSHVLLVERSREMLVADQDLLVKKKEVPTILINRWTGRPVDQEIQVQDEISVPVNIGANLSYATSAHPTLEVLQNRIEVSKSKVSLTYLESKPKIGVGLDYAMIKGRNDAIPNNGRDIVMPMGSITVPLHTRRFEAKREEEKIKQEMVMQEMNETRDAFTSEIHKAISNIEYADQEIEKLNRLKDITRETIELMRQEYASEGTRFEELLRLEMDLIDYDSGIISSELQRDLAASIILKYQ